MRAIRKIAKALVIDTEDPYYDAIHSIMRNLHYTKKGRPFELVTIRLSTPPSLPRNYQGNPKHRGIFMSSIDSGGIYETWGCQTVRKRAVQSWGGMEGVEVL